MKKYDNNKTSRDEEVEEEEAFYSFLQEKENGRKKFENKRKDKNRKKGRWDDEDYDYDLD